MKQIFKELWIENRNVGCLTGKSLLLLIILFGSFINYDFPYIIIFTYMLTSMEFFIMKMYGQINYILPQSNIAKKRKTIIKCVIVAGIYSLTNTISYVWLIQRRDEYAWSYDVILFLAYMTAVVFLYFFYYRSGLLIVGSSVNELEKENAASAFEITVNAFGCLLSVISCPLYIACKFGKVSFPAFLRDNICLIEICLGAPALAFLLYGALKNIKRIDYSEYID